MEISLRRLNKSDIFSLVKYADNSKIADHLTDAFPHPYTENDAINFIRTATDNEKGKLIFAIDLNKELIGCIGGFQKEDIYSRTCEFGYWIGEPFWGKGIATEAIRLFVPVVFETTNIVRLYAQPFETNTASRKALEKAGFELEAFLKNNVYKKGRLMGSCIYSIIKS